MRPCRLRVQGFTSFADPVEVDFEDLDLFAITGPTGAGKTSLLIAMTAALYGRAPEVADDLKQLISTGCDEARILFEFAAGGRRYRAQRVVHRTRPVQVRLEEQDGAGWKGLIRGAREAKGEVERVLGLPYETFTKVVLLPQGQVAEFLRGQGDRRRILTDLLGLEIYERVQRAANLEAGTAQAEADARERVLREEYADATAEQLAEVTGELGQARSRVEHLTRALAGMEQALDAARAEQARARMLRDAEGQDEAARASVGAADAEVAGARDLLAGLTRAIEAREAQVTALAYDPDRHMALRQALLEARQLAAARERSASVVRDLDDAGQRQKTLAGQRDQIAHAIEEAGRDLETAQRDAARRRETLDGLERQLGRRVEVARLRERAAQYAADREALEADTAGMRAAEEEVRAHRERVQVAIETAGSARRALTASELEHGRRARALDELRTSGREAERADRALAERRARHAGARGDHARLAAEAARAAAEVTSATAAWEKAQVAEAKAASALDAVRARHMAHTLRQHLAPGAPCPVCEQTVSMVPTRRAPGLKTAQTALDVAERARRAAAERLAEARQGAVRAEERARGAQHELDRATEALSAAEAALAACLLPGIAAAADWRRALADQIATAEAAAHAAAAHLDRAREEEVSATSVLRSTEMTQAALSGTLAERRQALDTRARRCEAAAAALARALALARAGGASLDVFLTDLECALDDAERSAAAADEGTARAGLRLTEATRAKRQAMEALEREEQAAARLRASGQELAREIAGLERSLGAVLGATDAASLAALPAHISALDEVRAQREVLVGRRAELQGEMDRGRERAAQAQARREASQRRAESTAAALAGARQAWGLARSALDEALAATGADVAQATFDDLAQRREGMAAERDRAVEAQSGLSAREQALAARIERAVALRQDLDDARQRAAIARELGQLLGGLQLRDWLLADAMRLLVEDASRHLERLCDSRYRLQARDIDFEVVDRWNGDAVRSVKTLSGGETFLTALAVALALADRVAGRAEAAHGQRPLESLFIDEGFGSLDPGETLDGVTLALEQLQSTHRVIGVITHLPNLADRLPAQIRVFKELGRSRVETVKS